MAFPDTAPRRLRRPCLTCRKRGLNASFRPRSGSEYYEPKARRIVRAPCHQELPREIWRGSQEGCTYASLRPTEQSSCRSQGGFAQGIDINCTVKCEMIPFIWAWEGKSPRGIFLICESNGSKITISPTLRSSRDPPSSKRLQHKFVSWEKWIQTAQAFKRSGTVSNRLGPCCS